MKFHRLTIHNIASIKDAEIDFSAEPLASSELFLITGNTGSGKSTILDAICLALYADTPRLSATEMQGISPDGDKKITIRDPRQLLRRNTGEGFVRLLFTGNNGIDYEAMWGVRRARNKPEGALQKRQWSLQRLDGKSMPMVKEDDIKAERKMVVGLDFSQFCRTTMLAQGEFTRFLNSRDDDKASILEKITGVEIYTQIGRRIYEEYMRRQKECDDACRLTESVVTLTPDEIKARGEAMAVVEKELVALGIEKRRLDSHADLLRRRSEMQSLSEALTAEQQRLRGVYSRLRGAGGVLAQDIGRREEEAGQLNETILQREGQRSVFENVASLSSSLQLISACRAAVEAERHVEEEIATAINTTLLPLREQTERKTLEAKAAYDKALGKLSDAEKRVELAGLPSLRKRREELQQQKMLLEQAGMAVTTYREQIERRQEVKRHLEEGSAKVRTARERVAALLPVEEAARGRRDGCREVLDRQRETVDVWARETRARLRPGDLCPVCGRLLDAPLPAEEALRQLCEQAEEAWRQADEVYNKAADDRRRCQAEADALQKNLDDEQTRFKADNSVERLREVAAGLCRRCGMAEIDEKTDTLIAELLAMVSSRIQESDRSVAMAESLEKETADMRKAVETARKAADALEKSLGEVDTSIAAARSKAEASKRIVAEREKEKAEAERHVGRFIRPEAWRSRPAEYGRELLDAARRWSDDCRRYEKMLADMSVAKLRHETVIGFEKQIVGLCREWEGDEPSSTPFQGDAVDGFAQLLSDVKSAVDRKAEAGRQLAEIVAKMSAENLSDADEAAIVARMAEIESRAGTLNREKARIEVEVATDAAAKERLAALLADIDAKKAVARKWERLNNLFGSHDGAKFRKIAQSYVLSSLIHAANGYLRGLSGRYTLHVEPGTFVVSVEDAYQGYTRRAASTISGGESFLVSLALALALSDIGHRLAVDTLFIDEGFGTLSGEVLQQAISTLRTLHTRSGRHVGIISHVEELRERIPVQIRVEQSPRASDSRITTVS